MNDIEQAHRELDRANEIIMRHEEHIFKLRGWLFAGVGAILAAYYTGTIDISKLTVGTALSVVTVLWLIVESRHVILVEHVVDRAGKVEAQIRAARDGQATYDGPRISEACLAAVRRWLPELKMTLLLNSAFYIVLILGIALLLCFLPAKP